MRCALQEKRQTSATDELNGRSVAMNLGLLVFQLYFQKRSQRLQKGHWSKKGCCKPLSNVVIVLGDTAEIFFKFCVHFGAFL